MVVVVGTGFAVIMADISSMARTDSEAHTTANTGLVEKARDGSAIAPV